MKHITLLVLFQITITLFAAAQKNERADRLKKDIIQLIDRYSQARDMQDTVLLKKILTADVDQLVSTGEWRVGVTCCAGHAAKFCNQHRRPFTNG